VAGWRVGGEGVIGRECELQDGHDKYGKVSDVLGRDGEKLAGDQGG